MPDSFLTGMLVPIIKKSNIDPSDPASYKPVVVSVMFSKLLELHILDSCSGAVLNPCQLSLGLYQNETLIWSWLWHMMYNCCISRGSAVYLCSLDAAGAFGGIPHSILLLKTMDIFFLQIYGG